ncbi:amidohydrolase [Methylobacterium mesophilicum SR1.6/6]|uniref:Amidohydrolase n=1 Tax=Methylobacterium mesophilicum SR1.6/6 TaxID=908290 RepID=A0A6B9FTG8_9HYPH|nr:amidohydrolase family protein [Methylobacterium mesophilicum]QGY05871.1 amidohydrolase [Methylobacterium mesophilicum SR1.6/6]
MNVEVRPQRFAAAPATPGIADCDIHPALRSPSDLDTWLEPRWREYAAQYGILRRLGMHKGPAYPKNQPDASRRDAYPPEGGRQGSSPSFMASHHLDAHNVTLGILNPLLSGQGVMNPDFSAALCRAVNHWQEEAWLAADRRLRASIVVPYEFADAAAAEIAFWAARNPEFVQVLLLSRTAEPLGNRRYWPIYEAAAEAGLPVAVHAFGYGGNPITSTGWPSYYIEEMTGHAQSCQAGLASMVVEGIFERFPTLRTVMVEAGFAWAPPLAWRLDKAWSTLRAETPHLKRLPSEYLREHVWWTSQPMEEPEPRAHLLDTIQWMGWDRLLFATDYPHWDFDDPAHALPLKIGEAERRGFFSGNAHALYGVAA